MPAVAAPFPHSVASFDPTDDGVLIWTRTEAPGEVTWTVARDADLGDVVATGTATPDPDRDHTVVVDVDGLEAATTYHYAFTVGGERSPVGRTRTLAGEGALDPARIVVVSCANLARAPLTVARAAAAVDDVDLVLHLGDYIYEDDGTKGDIPVDPPRDLVSVDDYRRRYRQARADTDLQLLHERHPMVAIWDDHDVADNTWDDGAKAHDPEEHGPFPERLAAANQARQEFVPVRLPDPDDDRRLWRSVPLGGLAELVVLDTRLGGRDRQPDDGEDLDDPDRSMLSEPQWAWATERITDRSRPWCLVSSTVPVSVMELPMPDHAKGLDAALPDGYAVRDGVALCTDQWDGYRAERRRLVSALDDRHGGAVIISGDIHSSWVIDGPFADGLRPVAGEVVASSISSTTMGGNLGRAATALAERVADAMEHVRWCDIDEHGFLVVDVSEATVEVSAWAVDPEDRSATARRMATWSIGPEPGARWSEVTSSSDEDDDGDPDTIEGLPAAGPPAGGRQPSRRPVLGPLVRIGAGALALVLARRVLRGVHRAVAARR